MLVHWFQIILIFCMSISLVVSILPYKYRNISCSGPDVNLIFGRYPWDVGTLATNYSEFHVCLPVCLIAYSLTKIIQRDISSSGSDILLEFFGDILLMLVQWFQIILICLHVYQSYLAICTIVLLLDV